MNSAEIPLDGMTVEQKLQLMERIWVDLSQNTNDLPSHNWHGDLLEQRRKAVQSGEATFAEWESVKQRLLSRHQ